LAGANGAGKSSVIGAFLREHGGEYYNPDEAARRIVDHHPAMAQTEANSLAWRQGTELLRQAIHAKQNFFVESTLGGETVAGLLEDALGYGFSVRVWFVGLATPALHVARVAARVKKGGHDIPEEIIRRRFDQARLNLLRLAPRLDELQLFDNSSEADPAKGLSPTPTLVMHAIKGRIVAPSDLGATPDWAKPIVASLLKARRK
jgi:predicted ABC-type ATPase